MGSAGDFGVRPEGCPWSDANRAATVELCWRDPLAYLALVKDVMGFSARGRGRLPRLQDMCKHCYDAEEALSRRLERRRKREESGGGGGGDAGCNLRYLTDTEKRELYTSAQRVLKNSKANAAAAAGREAQAETRADDALRRVGELEAKIAELTEQVRRGILEHGEREPPEGAGPASLLVMKLTRALESGRLPDDCFLRLLLESQLDVALARDGQAIRWHPGIIDFATTLYCYGGESVIHLLSGIMFEGCGKVGAKQIDMSKTNLMLPSMATIKRNLPSWNMGEGVHPVAVLQTMYMIRAKGLPMTVTLMFDETPVIPCLRVNEMLGGVQGSMGGSSRTRRC